MNNTYQNILRDFNTAFNGNNVNIINIANNITNIISADTFEPDNNVVISKRGNNKNYYVKRFIIETTTQGKRFSFITEGRGSKIENEI